MLRKGIKRFVEVVLKPVVDFCESRSLVVKLIFSYIVIISIVVAVVGMVIYRNFSDIARMEVYNNSRQMLQKEINDINKNIDTCRKTASIFARNKKLVELLNQKSDYTLEQLLEFKNVVLPDMYNIININSGINSIRIYADNPWFPDIKPVAYNIKSISGMPFYKEMQEKGVSELWNIDNEDTPLGINILHPQRVVTLYNNVYNSMFENMGLVEVNMHMNAFFSGVFDSQQTGNYFMCVSINGGGLILDSSNLYFKKIGWNEKDLQDILTKNTSGNAGQFSIKTGTGVVTVFYDYIEGIRSYIYRITSVEELDKNLNTIGTFVFFSAIVIILLLSVFTYIITSILFKKMRVILKAIRRVQTGELNVEIPVKGRDEAGELAYHFRKMMHKINELIFDAVIKQSAAKEAEILALQSQIDRHFIYNILEAVKMMAEVQYKYEISDIITSLGRMMRYSMSWKKQYVTLKDEIDHIRNYNELLNVRYDYEIKLSVDIDECLLSHEILKMTLQPIVENSVHHGIEPRGTGGKISIEVSVIKRTVYITIEDDGTGMEAFELKALNESLGSDDSSDLPLFKGNGIALKNVNERIRLFYGKEYGVEIDSVKDRFTRVTVRIPYLGRLMEGENAQDSYRG